MRIRTLLLVAAVLLSPVAPQGVSAETPADPWAGESTMLGGTARYDSGEWIYQDFVYDDYGANLRPAGSSQRVTLGATNGDFRYPSGSEYAGNAADIAEVRVRQSGADLEVRVELVTLVAAHTTVIGVGVDTGSGTLRPWPKAAGVSSVWDLFATVADGKIWIQDAAGNEEAADAEISVEENTFSFRIPGVAVHPEVDLVAGAGLWNASAGEWLSGSPTGSGNNFNAGGVTSVRVFDLAFNTRELEPRGGAWQEAAQSNALASGDVSEFRQTVSIEALSQGATTDYDLQPGFYNRIFRSIQNLGEGVAGSFPQYRSPLQPYALWIPERYEPEAPNRLILALHSLSVHHNQYRGGPVGGGGTSYLTFYEQLGDALDAVVVTPLARGPDGWYRNEALVDTIEVWEDVRAHYPIDDERTNLSGYSMGGYGAYRIGTLFPDRFATAISWAGVPTDMNRLENLHSVPFFIIHGTLDELVPITGVRSQAARFGQLGYEYRFHEHPTVDHLLLVWLDEWSREKDWMEGTVRVTSPPTVHFRVQPSMWTTSVSAQRRGEILSQLEELGADLTSSYWVRDVEVRGGGSTLADVKATSLAITDRLPQTESFSGVGLGPPLPYLENGTRRTLGPAGYANGFEVTLGATADVTLDCEGAGVQATEQISLSVTTDGDTVLRLDCDWDAWMKVVDATTGAEVDFSQDGDLISIPLQAGGHDLQVVFAS